MNRRQRPGKLIHRKPGSRPRSRAPFIASAVVLAVADFVVPDHGGAGMGVFPGHSCFLEKIANTVQCLDHVECGVAGHELLTQPFDVAIRVSLSHIRPIIVDRIHQCIAPLHHTGAAGQRLQKEKFGHSEWHVLVFPASACRKIRAVALEFITRSASATLGSIGGNGLVAGRRQEAPIPKCVGAAADPVDAPAVATYPGWCSVILGLRQSKGWH